MLDRKRKILTISRAVEASFTSSEWTEIGYLTGTDEWIDRHPRLLRSLNWGDSDYKGNVMDAVAHILDKDKENLIILFKYEQIAHWLRDHDPGAFAQLQAEVSGIEDVAHVEPKSSTNTGLEALADAQELLRSRGPTSAIDRVHTGLHDFLRTVCARAGISCPSEETANQFLKAILNEHPAFKNLGPRSDEIKRILRSTGAIVDAFGTLRNKSSLVHPNEALLGADEALLVINAARSLLRYFDSKLN